MFPIRDSLNLGKFPLVNISLIMVNLYVFFQELISPDLNQLVTSYGLIPSKIDFSKVETLIPFVTSLFLHAGFLHILSNMWFLWVFGDNVEAVMGHLKYLLFYLFCGVVASFSQSLFIANSSLPMLGASGAIAGVLGAYLKFFPHHKIDTIVPVFGIPLILAIPANIMLIYWFFTQAFNGVAVLLTATASIGSIAYIAHLGGFASGFSLSRYLDWRKMRWT